MKIYNKLVRDNIPTIIRNKYGKEPITYTLDEETYKTELVKKLHEEVAEFVQDRTIEELADILEVVYALAQCQNITPEKLEELRARKAAKNGAFKQRIFLEKVLDTVVNSKQ
jgi:predicted house-cleaning noncanonical NTP pyrophosphatase (MazG superfamily)